jgi:hypothetical protein
LNEAVATNVSLGLTTLEQAFLATGKENHKTIEESVQDDSNIDEGV